MIERDRLIKKLKNIIELEEGGIVLITSTLGGNIKKSDLTEGEKDRLLEITDTIRKESMRHRDKALDIIKKIGDVEEDEF